MNTSSATTDSRRELDVKEESVFRRWRGLGRVGIALAVLLCAGALLVGLWSRPAMAARRIEKMVGQPWKEAEDLAAAYGLRYYLQYKTTPSAGNARVFHLAPPENRFRDRGWKWVRENVTSYHSRRDLAMWIRPHLVVHVDTTGSIVMTGEYN